MQPTSKNCFYNNYFEIYNHVELFKMYMYNHPLSVSVFLIYMTFLYESRWLLAMTEFQNII